MQQGQQDADGLLLVPAKYHGKGQIIDTAAEGIRQGYRDLNGRVSMDVYLFCTDGLCGMMQAIEAVYPKSRLQRCIVHQIRSSTKYVSYKDIKQVVADLKKVYTAVTLEEAEAKLESFAAKWRKQYPSCVKSWEENWEVLSTFFG